MDYEELIKLITEEVTARLNELKTDTADEKAEVLLVLDREGKVDTKEELFRQVKLIENSFPLSVVKCSEKAPVAFGWKRVFAYDPLQIDELISQASVIVIPYFSVSVLGRLSSLIDDLPLCDIILKGILEGKKIVIARDVLDENHHLPLGFKKVVEELVTKIRSFGIEVVNLRQLAEKSIELKKHQLNINQTTNQPSQNSAKKVILTSDDVTGVWKTGGTEINVPPNSIITALAKETAVSKNVQIIIKGEH